MQIDPATLSGTASVANHHQKDDAAENFIVESAHAEKYDMYSNKSDVQLCQRDPKENMETFLSPALSFTYFESKES